MPKVTEEYKHEVRSRIMKAAVDACSQKPAYLLTMRDVVRASGMSPGAVYSYYEDINSLWFDCMNKGFAGKDIASSVSRKEGEPAEEYIERCLGMILDLENHISPQYAKIYYELEIKRAADHEFAQKRREESIATKAYKTFLSDMAAAISEGTNLSEDSVYIFLKSFLEGLAKNIIESRCYGIETRDTDISTQISLLKESIRRIRDVQK